MFGLSFGEILIIAIIAVLFLGPDKLPKAFVDIAKFFKAVKKTINDAKDALDREVHISEIKQEALEYKKKFEQGAENIKQDIVKSGNLNEITDILNTPLDSNPTLESKANEKSANTINTMKDLEIETKKMTSKVNLKPKTTESKPKTTKSKKTESKPKTTKPKTTKTKSDSPAESKVPKRTRKPKVSEQ